MCSTLDLQIFDELSRATFCAQASFQRYRDKKRERKLREEREVCIALVPCPFLRCWPCLRLAHALSHVHCIPCWSLEAQAMAPWIATSRLRSRVCLLTDIATLGNVLMNVYQSTFCCELQAMAPRKRANSIGGPLSGAGGATLQRHGSAPLAEHPLLPAFPAGLLGEDGKLKVLRMISACQSVRGLLWSSCSCIRSINTAPVRCEA